MTSERRPLTENEKARLADWARRADLEQAAWADGRPGPAIPPEMWEEPLYDL